MMKMMEEFIYMTRRQFARKPALWLSVFSLWMPFLGGCDSRGLPMVPVRGKITYGKGDWPKPGVIYFTGKDVAKGVPLRPAVGHFDVHGNIKVNSFEEGDGLVAGRYKLGIECWEIPPGVNGSPGKSYVPKKYQSASTSGLEVTADSSAGTVQLDIDIPKP
jgi:hypothetical protein